MFKKSALLLALLLVGCANSADDTVNAVNKITLPAITASTDSKANTTELQGMYSSNQEVIAHLTAEIKEEKIKDVNTDDILDTHSKIHSVFKALTQLEEMNQLNDVYLKEKNKNGLVMIEQALQPLKNRSV